MNIQDFFQTLTERLHTSAHVRTIYGDPITADGKTIVPVARVAYGFGGGSGRKGQADGEEGGGGGGGVAATPVGVVEITPSETRFIPVGETRKLALAAALGILFGFWAGRRRTRR